MSTPVKEDEFLKAACHGLLAGSALPVLAYNLSRRNHGNVLIYLALIAFEVFQVAGHLIDADKAKS